MCVNPSRKKKKTQQRQEKPKLHIFINQFHGHTAVCWNHSDVELRNRLPSREVKIY